MTTFAVAIDEATSRLQARGIEDARLEAEVLLAHASRMTRSRLLAVLHDAIGEPDSDAFGLALDRRLQHEPLAYITGYREFYGIEIRCDARALIPRPETEMLVDLALEELQARGDGLRVVDVGTGTGAIAVAIASTHPSARVLAVDASEDALRLAGENVRARGLSDRVALRRADLLEGAGEFDLALANLPYVSREDWQALAPEVRDWEPDAALVGGERGTEVIERLLDTARPHLAPGAVLALEVGDGQARRVGEYARVSFPTAEIHARTDLAGIERVVVVRLPLREEQ